MACAKMAAPSSPNNGISLVLDLPGVGHLETTTMAAPEESSGWLLMLFAITGTVIEEKIDIDANDQTVSSSYYRDELDG